MNEDMSYEIDKLTYYVKVMLLSSKASEEAIYWKGYSDGIDKLLDIVKKCK